jgi:hypothetical protein
MILCTQEEFLDPYQFFHSFLVPSSRVGKSYSTFHQLGQEQEIIISFDPQ